MNDQQAVELINRSLLETLSELEQTELISHLARSPQSQAYADLAKRIQQELVDQISQADGASSEPGPGLSQTAKARLANRISAELDMMRNESSSHLRRVAEDNTDYQSGQDGIADPPSQ